MGLVERSLAGQEIRVKAMTARGALGKVERRLDKKLLDKQVVLDGIAEEHRSVDIGIVKGVRVGLVVEEGRPGNAKDLQCQAGRAAEPRVGPGMRRTVRKADQRIVLSRGRIDALSVFSRQLGEDLDLAQTSP